MRYNYPNDTNRVPKYKCIVQPMVPRPLLGSIGSKLNTLKDSFIMYVSAPKRDTNELFARMSVSVRCSLVKNTSKQSLLSVLYVELLKRGAADQKKMVSVYSRHIYVLWCSPLKVPQVSRAGPWQHLAGTKWTGCVTCQYTGPDQCTASPRPLAPPGC